MDDALRAAAITARSALHAGELRGATLVDALCAVPFRDRDAWVDELLGLDGVPDDVPDLPRGAVPYVPCSVEDVLAMVADVPVAPDDLVVDLGSGLGRVVILAHLLSGARAHGVELQEPLVVAARERSAELGLSAVTFEHANVVDAALDGSIFFLHAPFNGPMLDAAIRNLERVARRRPIVVCTVGMEFRDVPWLRPRSSSSVSLALYESVVPGVPQRVGAALLERC